MIQGGDHDLTGVTQGQGNARSGVTNLDQPLRLHGVAFMARFFVADEAKIAGRVR